MATSTVTKILLRRGTDADRQSVTLAAGEPGFTTDTKELYIGDGSTVGGIKVGSQPGGQLKLSQLSAQSIVPWPGTNHVVVSGGPAENPTFWVEGETPSIIVGDGTPSAGTTTAHLMLHNRSDGTAEGSYIDYKHDAATASNANGSPGSLKIRCNNGTTNTTVLEFTSAGSSAAQKAGQLWLPECHRIYQINHDATQGTSAGHYLSGGFGALTFWIGAIGKPYLSGGSFQPYNIPAPCQHGYDIGAWYGNLVFGDISPVDSTNYRDAQTGNVSAGAGRYYNGGITMMRMHVNRDSTAGDSPSGVRIKFGGYGTAGRDWRLPEGDAAPPAGLQAGEAWVNTNVSAVNSICVYRG